MKTKTNTRNINGTWYLRIPPAYVEHLDIKGEAGDSIEMEIQDEQSKKGNYISTWIFIKKKE